MKSADDGSNRFTAVAVVLARSVPAPWTAMLVMSASKQGRLFPVPWAARLVMSAPKQGRSIPASGRDDQHDQHEGVPIRRAQDVDTKRPKMLG